MPDDISGSISTTGRVTVGNSLTGEIETTNDSDAYAVELVAGRTYRIDLEGAATGKGTLADPFLRWLRDSSGNGLHGTRDYDGGEGLNPRQVFTPQVSGTYYITASGQGDSVGTYTLRVTDTSAPVFGASAYGFQLGENTDGGTTRVSLGTVSATDPEGASVGYSIVGGNELGSFEIDAASGELFYKGSGEDYESETTSYELRVRASDGGLHTDMTVNVNVTDVAEAPVFAETSYAFSLAENADGGTDRVSLGAVTATDPDNDPVAYSIVGGDPVGLFAIDESTGELFYVGAGEDYEAGAVQFDLTIRASDGALTADAAVSVAITDAPEQTIVAPADPEILQTVSELAGEDFSRNISTAGRIVVDDTATGNIGTRSDRDWFAVELVADREYQIDLRGGPTGDGTLSDPYLRGIHDAEGTLISGTTNDDGGAGYNSRVTFTASETGAYYIAAGAFGRLGTYELEVRDVSPQTAQQETVNGPPAFGQVSYEFSLAENTDGSANRVSLGTVTATDPDNDPVAYSIVGGDPGGLFAIDEATGELSYQGSGEDYESETTRYDLTVRASDGALHTDMTVNVNVTDVAEAPAFAETSYTFSLAENAGGDTIPLSLGLVQATDPENSTIIYSIESGDPGGLFEIDPATGALSYRGAGEDYESETKSYELTVRASDGGLHTDMTVNVNVTDVEEYVSLQQEASVSEPDGEDLPANVSTTGAVAVGGSARGKINGATDRDWFAVTLEAGRSYRIDLEGSETGAGTLADPYLRGIHDADGVLLADATNDDYGVGENSRVYFTADEAGTYYVAAGSFGHWTGAYTLSVTDVTDTFRDDYTAGTGTSGAVSVGDLARGDIEIYGDRDWFAVDLDAGRTYRIDLEGDDTGDGALLDPYLYGIHHASGYLIAGTENDDGGAGRSSQVYFTATEDATYYVAAGAYGYWEGAYTLLVTDVTADVPDDFEAGTGTTGAVSVGGSATGEVEFRDDRDWFAVTLEAGSTYRIDLEGDWTLSGTLYDPYLYGIYDADGDLIANTTNDDGGFHTNSRVTFTAAQRRELLRGGRRFDRVGRHLQAVGDGVRGRFCGGDRDHRRGGGGRLGNRRDRCQWRPRLVRGDARGGQDLPDRPGGRVDRGRHPEGPVSARGTRRGRQSHRLHDERRRRRKPQQPGVFHGGGCRDLLRGGRRLSKQGRHLHAVGRRGLVTCAAAPQGSQGDALRADVVDVALRTCFPGERPCCV